MNRQRYRTPFLPHRSHLSARPFPQAWNTILQRNAPFGPRLDPARRVLLDHAILCFADSHIWEGCGGFSLREEHQATIAAHAMRLTLGFSEDYLDDVDSILVYPSAYEAPHRQLIGGGVVLEGRSQRLGESWYHGPVILAWNDIQSHVQSSRRPHNVILHEFAHQLDFRNGSHADGIPSIETNEQADEWISVTEAAYERLCKIYESGRTDLIDEYATANKAEFFAVTTEVFFEAPDSMAERWPKLFGVMKRFYNQDPRIESSTP